MATHSSIFAWRIPWTEDPEGLQSIGSPKVGHDCSNLSCMQTQLRIGTHWVGSGGAVERPPESELCEGEKGQKHGGNSAWSEFKAILHGKSLWEPFCSPSFIIHHIFFDIEKKEKFKKEKMFMFSLVFAFFASCSLDGSNLICRVTKEKWFAERRCLPEGMWHGVRRPENAMNVSHMGGCFSGSFFGSCPPLDYCSQRSKVEKREQSQHPTQAVQLVQLCLAPRYRQQGKMQCIGGGEETILPKLLYLGVWKVRRVWKWDYRINV